MNCILDRNLPAPYLKFGPRVGIHLEWRRRHMNQPTQIIVVVADETTAATRERFNQQALALGGG